jgi:hypothetical protein
MAKWIKNNSGINKTYEGQLITNQSYYEIQSNEELSWANNSTLLTDIGSGDAVVAKDDSGTTDITDVAEAINHLKDENPLKIDKNTPVHTFALAEGHTLRARLIGIYNQSITKNTTTDLDWAIPHTPYIGVNKQSYMDGIEYHVKDAEIGDTMKFQVIDKDGLVYPAGTVLDEFGTDWAVMPNQNTIRLYKAKLIVGMYIRVKYTSTGTINDPHVLVNLFRHMDTDINL